MQARASKSQLEYLFFLQENSVKIRELSGLEFRNGVDWAFDYFTEGKRQKNEIGEKKHVLVTIINFRNEPKCF